MRIYKSPNRKRQIYLSGGWGYGNRGDNAILMATLKSLEENVPDANIHITSYSPEELLSSQGLKSAPSIHKILTSGTKFRQFYLNVRYRMWVRSGRRFPLPEALEREFQQLKLADVVVLAGGGYFNDNWKDMERAQYATIRMAHRAGTPVIIYGQTLGPFSVNTLNGRLKEHLQLVTKVVCRDQQSVSNALKAGVPERKVVLSADEASLLPVLSPEKPSSDVPIVGVMIQYYRRHEHENGVSPEGGITKQNYFPSIMSALQRYAEQRKVRFRLIPSTIWDEVPMSRLASLMDNAGLEFEIVKNPSAAEYVDVCQGVYFMLSTNMHPVIIASTNSRPSICLSYNFKLDYYMQSIGLDRFVNRIDDFVPDVILSQLLELHDNCALYQAVVAENRKQVIARAQRNVEAVKWLLC